MAFAFDDHCFAHQPVTGRGAARVRTFEGLGDRIVTLLVAAPLWFMRALRSARCRRLTTNALTGLDNHTLADIGVGRAEIRAVADGLARDVNRY